MDRELEGKLEKAWVAILRKMPKKRLDDPDIRDFCILFPPTEPVDSYVKSALLTVKCKCLLEKKGPLKLGKFSFTVSKKKIHRE